MTPEEKKAKARAAARAYYQAHKNDPTYLKKIHEATKKWQEAHKARTREIHDNWVDAHRDEWNEYNAQYARDHYSASARGLR